ncbi:MAG: acyl-CoA dehydrogenase family protein [Deltaproteobacteria bacterium]|nr:acyl-CoA dehydrogenase family protein [Deltaproteobacteria bacterium]MBI3389068.1 acyl-CoA dehydrogenase family protein [Deltaproteobacteria bacterium]
MPFVQDPPQLGNQYRDDRVLRDHLARTVPPDVAADIAPSLDDMGRRAAEDLFELNVRYRTAEPELIQWDAWGNRIDEIRITPAWREYARVAVETGLIATAYERRHAEHSRVHQMALVYLFHPSSQVYTCPLSMTDGAARTLELQAAPALRERAIPRLTSRDPARAWTSGQWMTEQAGGSDVGLSETIARQSPEGWRLYGKKWFTSATTSDMALTLARPEGNGPGGRGLAMFYLEQRTPDGRLNGIRINRLKDKLGTRSVPTAELELDGTLAEPVAGLSDGTRNITPMLNITRTWNAVCAAAAMRRGVALARDYARRRVAFGAPLSEKPLHLDTLAAMQAETEAAFAIVFHAVALLGREELGVVSDEERAVLRVLQPIVKLTTGKQALAVASETLEAFGGAGYVEDTGLPVLLRDTQVLSIWEGTTNVLSLDVFRAISREGGLAPYLHTIRQRASVAGHASLIPAARAAVAAADHAEAWLAEAQRHNESALEAGARRFALTLGRAMELALLIESAEWAIANRHDGRAAAAAVRFASAGVDCLNAPDEVEASNRALAMDEDLALA